MYLDRIQVTLEIVPNLQHPRALSLQVREAAAGFFLKVTVRTGDTDRVFGKKQDSEVLNKQR